MRGFSRTLIYVLFIVVIFYLFALRAQRSGTILLAEEPLVFMVKGDLQGKVIFKKRADGSEYLLVKLNGKVPEEALILVEDKEGVARELGRFKGATFLSTLPQDVSFEELLKVEIKLLDGRILAEARLKKNSWPQSKKIRSHFPKNGNGSQYGKQK